MTPLKPMEDLRFRYIFALAYRLTALTSRTYSKETAMLTAKSSLRGSIDLLYHGLSASSRSKYKFILHFFLNYLTLKVLTSYPYQVE